MRPSKTVYFNGDLTLLKSARNEVRLLYSQRGGTDYKELKDPRQRRGPGPSILWRPQYGCRSRQLFLCVSFIERRVADSFWSCSFGGLPLGGAALLALR
jgi:hypothetical protein